MKTTKYIPEAVDSYNEFNEAPTEFPLIDITLNIDGLRANSDGTFTLEGVRQANIDYPDIAKILVRGGLSRREAEILVDKFADEVSIDQFSKILAQRMSHRG